MAVAQSWIGRGRCYRAASDDVSVNRHRFGMSFSRLAAAIRHNYCLHLLYRYYDQTVGVGSGKCSQLSTSWSAISE